MDSKQDSSPYGIVWAAVFLTVLILWGLTIVAFAGDPRLASVAIALLIGAVPGFINVPLLLATGESRPTILVIGRVLAWSQTIALLVACIIGIIVAAE